MREKLKEGGSRRRSWRHRGSASPRLFPIFIFPFPPTSSSSSSTIRPPDEPSYPTTLSRLSVNIFYHQYDLKMSATMDAARRFFLSPQFAVAGASNDRSKFGYKSRSFCHHFAGRCAG